LYNNYTLAFHLISLFNSCASFDSMWGLWIFFGIIRPSWSRRDAGKAFVWRVPADNPPTDDAELFIGLVVVTLRKETSFSSWTKTSEMEKKTSFFSVIIMGKSLSLSAMIISFFCLYLFYIQLEKSFSFQIDEKFSHKLLINLKVEFL